MPGIDAVGTEAQGFDWAQPGTLAAAVANEVIKPGRVRADGRMWTSPALLARARVTWARRLG